MIAASQPRSLTAEVNWGADASAVLWVGSAPVHQFWPLLAPHFGGTFLPPQRRMEGDAVAWTWRSTESEAPSASDLAALRAHLEGDLERFTDSQPGASSQDDSSRSSKNRESLALLLALLKSIVPELLAKSDAELAKYVARTEGGCRIHSWGAKSAATPLLPEQLGRDVTGTAIHAGRGIEGVAVVLESADQSFKSQTRSDEAGHFRFSNIRRGDYRLRGSHPVKQFAAEGMAVAVAGEPLTGLKLRATSPLGADDAEAVHEEAAEPRRRRRWPRYTAGAAFAAAIAAWILWHRAASTARPTAGGQSDAAASPARAAPPAPDAPPTTRSSKNSQSAEAKTVRSRSSPSLMQAAADPEADAGAKRSTSSAAGAGSAAAAAAAGQDPSPRPVGSPPAATGAPGARSSGAPAAAAQAGPGKAGGSASAPAPAGKQPASGPSPASAESTGAAKPKPKPTPQPPPPAAPARASEPDAPAPGAVTVPIAAPEAGWKHRTDLRIAPWRTRLLIDPILPTIPDGEFSLAAVAVLRQRSLAQQREKIPPTFSTPHCAFGYRVAAPAGSRWVLPAEAGGASAAVTAAGAILIWPNGTSPRPGIYSLVGARGAPWARIHVAAAQSTLVESAADVRVSVILQVQLAAGDRSAPHRFGWRRAGGGELPPDWTQDIGGENAQLEVPVAAAAGAVRDDSVALFDTESGWGLTARLAQTFRSVE